MPSVKHRLVGVVSYQILARRSDGTIPLDIEDGWEAKHIVRVSVPQLAGADIGGGRRSDGNIKWFKGGVYQLQKAFEEIEARGLKHLILSFAGSFYPRMIRGSTRTPSEHSFATALDINAGWNGLSRTPAPVGAMGTVIPLVPIFEKWGFRWGGYFSRRDGMHFELARLIPAPVAASPVAASPVAPVLEIYLNERRLEGARYEPVGGKNRLVAPVRAVTEALGHELMATDSGHLKAWKKGAKL